MSEARREIEGLGRQAPEPRTEPGYQPKTLVARWWNLEEPVGPDTALCYTVRKDGVGCPMCMPLLAYDWEAMMIVETPSELFERDPWPCSGHLVREDVPGHFQVIPRSHYLLEFHEDRSAL